MSIARIRKDDTVVAVSGVDSGKTGKVKSVSRKDGTAVVEGLNMKKKAVRRSKDFPDGGFVTIEAPIPLCKLMPYDADAKKGTRVATGSKDGKKARKLVKSGKVI